MSIATVKSLITSRLAGGSAGSITAVLLRDSLEQLCDAIDGDRIAANVPYSTPTSPLTATDVEAALDEIAALLNTKAPLASPALAGVPTAPTASTPTSSTQIASTAFVHAVVDSVIDSAPGALDTLNELAAALGDDANFSTTVTNSLALKAPLASPALTGNPTAPTQSASDNSTKIATTAFVQGELASTGSILAGDIIITLDASPPSNYVELDGATIVGGATTYPAVASRYTWMVSTGDLILPDMRGRFPRGWANGSTHDPDRASRTARAGDGQTGDYPGTYQSDELKSHKHNLRRASGSGNDYPGWTGNTYGANSSNPIEATGGNETRPTNMAVMFCMRMS